MLIAIGSDHAGLEMKTEIIKVLKELNCEYIDFGTNTSQSVDYPDFGEKVSDAVSIGKVDRGILICGTGIGMSIVANKFPNIRAALCNELFSAKMSRLHNDANILILGGRIIGKDLAKEIVRTWITTPFEGGRHTNRLKKITLIEDKTMKGGPKKSKTLWGSNNES
ncbi:ribose 5-phosphate isomerase B [Dissulfurispira thermophila]|uniref:Ribose 5-phosphate isomerase B n=2 Tax=root TaxID=1 RepID=A0A7G1H019_9BACT|nr:ribose 5-phosphate isomerase B [Dissulfurispira thermophila]BCB95642.1 ribose 5-phosphate isomerase B [Dissulfurispira thermophila]